MTKLTAAELSATLRNNPDLSVEDAAQRDEPAAAKAYRQSHPPAPTEEQEQMAVFTWAALAARVGGQPELALLHHTPNGGLRDKVTAGRLKAAGVKPGVPDLHLPVARRGYHGLWIEMKRADRSNHPTPEQTWWHERLRAEGHHVAVCYGADEAISAIEEYLRKTD